MNPDIIKALILGIVQGLTEFFPVSSTAHLILFPWFFGWSGEIDTLTFDVALHGGTLMALLVCFFGQWLDMLTHQRRMLFFIILACVPAGVAGVLLHKVVEHTLRSPLVIAASLVIVGFVMLMAEKDYAKLPRRTLGQMSLIDALFIGLAQAVALIPGVSRSGITITAGISRRITRESAARFSFLLSTPVIGGATLLEAAKLVKHPEAYHLDLFVTGFGAAFVSGVIAIRFLLSFLKEHPLNVFVYYRFTLAAVIGGAWLLQR
jgi:undecaprenyl-diphosphatase